MAPQLITVVVAPLAADKLETAAWSVLSAYSSQTILLHLLDSFKYGQMEFYNDSIQCLHYETWVILHGECLYICPGEKVVWRGSQKDCRTQFEY